MIGSYWELHFGKQHEGQKVSLHPSLVATCHTSSLLLISLLCPLLPFPILSAECNPRSPDRCPLLPLHVVASSLTNWCCHLPSLLRAAAFDRPHLLPSAPSEISDAASRAQQRRCPSLVVTTSPAAAAAAPVLSPPLQPHFFLCPALPSLTPYRSRTILLLLSFPRCPTPTTPLLPSAPAAPASATTAILFLSREDSPATIASFATSNVAAIPRDPFRSSRSKHRWSCHQDPSPQRSLNPTSFFVPHGFPPLRLIVAITPAPILAFQQNRSDDFFAEDDVVALLLPRPCRCLCSPYDSSARLSSFAATAAIMTASA
ncbi:hypothetical protein B296_00048945 [Ensete ventricosum]|uniref:Uncharacterized protein n=1 Tax=Ensete ventricosum TaxID=4639 RepID=A0A426YSQ7_ENSVE|nr:hypothetical protein B296_00048945 [Ensete ventricosum]